jgi:hypothetical protein
MKALIQITNKAKSTIAVVLSLCFFLPAAVQPLHAADSHWWVCTLLDMKPDHLPNPRAVIGPKYVSEIFADPGEINRWTYQGIYERTVSWYIFNHYSGAFGTTDCYANRDMEAAQQKLSELSTDGFLQTSWHP